MVSAFTQHNAVLSRVVPRRKTALAHDTFQERKFQTVIRVCSPQAHISNAKKGAPAYFFVRNLIGKKKEPYLSHSAIFLRTKEAPLC